MNITIVIPCYNVAAHITEVISTIPPEIHTIIAVNDCSKDNTADILARLAEKENRLILLRHDKNGGVGAAMITGYQKAMEMGADIIIKMDGDGQMDPAHIPALLKPIRDGAADFTKGNRFRDLKALRAMPLSRRIGNLGLSFMIKAASGYWNIFDPTNGFTAIRASLLSDVNLNRIHPRYYYETSLINELYYAGAVIQDIPMKARYGSEISGLSRTKTLIEFPPRLLIAFLRRILLKYFLYEFTLASVYLLFGVPLFLYGCVFGVVNYIKYTGLQLPTPTGTIMIATLSIMLGFQFLLSALSYDLNNYPKR